MPNMFNPLLLRDDKTTHHTEDTELSERGELGDIWKRIVDFNDIHFPEWSHEDLRLLSNALAGEVGELCDATKHFYGGGTNPELVGKETPEHIAEEAFDVFVYLILLLGADGYGLSRFCHVADKKLDVLYARMAGKVGKT